MDHIRKTMMQHDALFKEQVQALHRLYNIQKASMQEIRRRNYSRAQVFAFSPESLVLVEGQFCGSVLEGKPLRPPVYTGGRAHKQDALGLSLSPFCTLKEIKGSGSLWMDGMGAEPFLPAPSKPVRNFDLEKLPEDDADESTDLEGIAEEWKGSNLPDSTESFQDLGSSIKVASTGPESEPYSSQVDMDLSPKDPITCSQDSSILESQHCESKELDEFIIQRSIHLETNSNPERQNLNLPAVAKDSNNGGSNSMESQDTKFSKKNDTCEEDQASPSNKVVFLSEYEEAPLDVWRPSVSSTNTDSEIKQSHSNSESGNMTSSEKPPVVTEDNQNRKGKSILYEECETMAAEILLSFAPNRSQAGTRRHVMEGEPGKSYGDFAATEEKPNLCEKRCANFSNGGRVYESLKLEKIS
ncbi:hypothetical protein SADUNF_Sadunf06G0211400 [Salix dunnii]|uniref:Uncharacterized protein n=1 Tax=Salix dunnii TaxID=1413687 RepID=A0A835K5Q2_9ROSI|nr:hypothetical protein SADUNF_Sadunf06G0211400 [Salix dunnii]